MKKLKLDLAELSVESFTTSSSASGQGTVEGHSTFGGDSCDAQYTCGPQTCGPAYCGLDTFNPDCSGPTTGSLAGDSCDYVCQTIWTDSPHECPCY